MPVLLLPHHHHHPDCFIAVLHLLLLPLLLHLLPLLRLPTRTGLQHMGRQM